MHAASRHGTPRLTSLPKDGIGGVHNPNLLTNKLFSNPICRQIEISLSSVSNITLTSAIDFRQLCRQTKHWGGGCSTPPHSPMVNPLQ